MPNLRLKDSAPAGEGAVRRPASGHCSAAIDGVVAILNSTAVPIVTAAVGIVHPEVAAAGDATNHDHVATVWGRFAATVEDAADHGAP